MQGIRLGNKLLYSQSHLTGPHSVLGGQNLSVRPGVNQFIKADWSLSSKNLSLSNSPALGLHNHTTTPSLFTWVLGFELGFSCLLSEAFTN